MRASRLAGLKASPLLRNRLVAGALRASPVLTHVLEDAYRFVLARRMRPEARLDALDLGARLADFAARFPDAAGDCDERPVILLAAGWRSGSTLLQRVLISSDELMIWGEPFARSGIVSTLASQFRAFNNEWPPAAYFVSAEDDLRSERWIANSYPAAADLVQAHRSFLVKLLAEPARALGRSGWGFKEVRLDGGHVHYLKMLFPEARFVFLVRDPYAAYASFRHYIKSDFHDWPERPIASASEFGRLWRDLATSLRDACQAVDGLWLRYEDYLRTPALHEALSAHVAAALRPPGELALIPSAGQIGASETRRPENKLLWHERRALRRVLGDVAGAMGYHG